ncbi:SNF1-related protein kinase regulatory subunit gamma-like PV42a [Ricinus communis]|uniref:SNF1-related protein kinase regulatory subunit gamma-like PV42a n=1 Tax=Ricinus communis TaxID=3988 RepID=UPI00201A2F12|nr:SNF1-related protein kinase regulatory subunit gamma-like PV42a [Ricinus communis]XP_048234582.1 SNF1-related protein kinase regulatory subunit gamma-like PV42a [Ricinus communis]XP_048234583.1 SNF1-related protein kinase regulatory subunit gamma-like PV42a [Ricinus communis]
MNLMQKRPLTLFTLAKQKSPRNMQEQKLYLNTSTKSLPSQNERLKDRRVKDLMVDKRRLVEVPYTASLAHTMNTLVANQVVAVPVAAPPGHWIGAGGSMIMESDKQTGAVRKHYIGMVTMLDILAHIAGDDQMNGGDDDASDLDRKMSVPVSSIIGHCLEGLSLWTLNPNTSILDCMEVFSKGIHRALVPLDSHMENISGVELVESASSYRMLTQMDLVKFLKEHASELQGFISRPVSEIGAVNENVYAITGHTKVIDAIKCMRASLLNAVPIVVASDSLEDYSKKLINGKGRMLIGTFSATDLRGCHLTALQTWLPLTALEFTESVASAPIYASPNASNMPPRELVTCYLGSPLEEVIDKAVTKHVHRVWAVDQQGFLVGLVSLTDIIKVVRASLLSDTHVA